MGKRDDMRRLLQQAALDLYRERGYDQTTTAEIAARVGVTERTFFRYFRDKREVLFDGEMALRTAITQAIAAAPSNMGAMETLLVAFRSVIPIIENNRPFSEPRKQVIDGTPALQERELAKVASLTAALALALQERGGSERQASLAAQVGFSTFGQAVTYWFDDPATTLETHLNLAFEELRSIIGKGYK